MRRTEAVESAVIDGREIRKGDVFRMRAVGAFGDCVVEGIYRDCDSGYTWVQFARPYMMPCTVGRPMLNYEDFQVEVGRVALSFEYLNQRMTVLGAVG